MVVSMLLLQHCSNLVLFYVFYLISFDEMAWCSNWSCWPLRTFFTLEILGIQMELRLEMNLIGIYKQAFSSTQ